MNLFLILLLLKEEIRGLFRHAKSFICGNGRNYARPGFEFEDVRHSVSMHVSLGDFQVGLMLIFLDRLEWELLKKYEVHLI